MEDILASIRRIIADDQSRLPPIASAPFRRTTPLNVAAPVAITPPDEPPPAPAMAGHSAGTETAREAEIMPAAPAPVRATSPLRARLQPFARPAVDAGPSVLSAPHLNPPPMSMDVLDLKVIDEIASAGIASILQPDAVQSSPEVLSEPGPLLDLSPIAPDPVPEQALPPEPTVVAEAVATPIPPVETPAVHDLDWDAGIQPLVSPAVGATVESSFQALASSVFMQNSSAVEDMMREMLRPMLKTWLDDNLPSVVERLVRCEIERVARGGRA